MQSRQVVSWHPAWRGALDTSLCDKVCQWFFSRYSVSSTNITDRLDIAEILLKVALNTISLILTLEQDYRMFFFILFSKLTDIFLLIMFCSLHLCSLSTQIAENVVFVKLFFDWQFSNKRKDSSIRCSVWKWMNMPWIFFDESFLLFNARLC